MNTNVETFTDWRDYYELTKPRVVMLIVFTAIVGMFLSVPGWPGVEPLILARSASAWPRHQPPFSITFLIIAPTS